MNKWKPTAAQDEAPVPEWATTRGAAKFRQAGAADIVAQVSNGDLPPALITRKQVRPRGAAYAVPTWLWNLIVESYPEMRPTDALINEVTATWFRNDIGGKILDPAYEEGRHSYSYSQGSRKDATRKPWEVWFSPRLWVEAGVERLVADQLIDETQYKVFVRLAKADKDRADKDSPVTRSEFAELAEELEATREELRELREKFSDVLVQINN